MQAKQAEHERTRRACPHGISTHHVPSRCHEREAHLQVVGHPIPLAACRIALYFPGLLVVFGSLQLFLLSGDGYSRHRVSLRYSWANGRGYEQSSTHATPPRTDVQNISLIHHAHVCRTYH